MYFFIAIIFIAELIITATILFFVIKADRKACELSDKVLTSRDGLIESIKCTRELIVQAKEKILAGIDYLSRKQRQYKMKMIKHILMYVLLFSLRGRYKKAASICSMIVLAKEFYDKNYATV